MQKLQLNPSTNLGRGCLIVFALAWTLFSCAFFLMALVPFVIEFSANGSVESLGFTLLFSLCSLPFLAIGIGLLFFAVRPLIAATRLEKPDITVSTTTPSVGDEVTFTYSQVFKRATEVELIQFKLILRESAHYRSGKNSHTITHDNVIQEFTYPARRYEATERLNVRRDWIVPADAMHTFRGTNNQLRWFIQAQIKMQGWPDYIEEYEIQVAPKVRA